MESGITDAGYSKSGSGAAALENASRMKPLPPSELVCARDVQLVERQPSLCDSGRDVGSLGPSQTGVFARDDGKKTAVVLFRRHLARSRFEHAPDIFHQNFMSSGIRMNAIG
jgi:hypothetical protein